MMNDFDPHKVNEGKDKDLDGIIRPQDLEDFTGQDKIVANLKIFVAAARMRGESLDHVLFHGPPGLGKTTLAHIIANELGVNMKVTSGPILDKPGDLAGLLTSLEEGDVLFIDEIHRLSPVVEEYLYSAMEDFVIDIMIDKGPGARSVRISLNPFTLVGATTRSGLLTSPLRARFGITCAMEYYDTMTLVNIVKYIKKRDGAKTYLLLKDIFPQNAVDLGMMAKNTSADLNVIALIGERGREVREFIENDLKLEGLKRSIVVVATSDQRALMRLKAAKTATALAEYFREQGKDVLLMMDSLTRFSMAQREIGLAIGEPPVSRGYPPSVYAEMPKLLERAGNSDRGSITGMYTVLVDGDDFNEPITDTARGILDGHIVLSRKLANKGHYPAIDVLASISRVMSNIASPEHKKLAGEIKKQMAIYKESEDLINVGAYNRGSSAEIDMAIDKMPDINGFLCQAVGDKVAFEETLIQMQQIVG